MHKRRSFEREREVRALIYRFRATADQRFDVSYDPSPEGGLYVGVDLSVLIETIHVPPLTAPWFADTVRALVARFPIDKEVRQSRLAGDPFFY